MSVLRMPTPQSACPPAVNMRPSARTVWPLQNILLAVLGIPVKAPVEGFQRVAELPPSAGGPSHETTSPVFMTARLIATIGQLKGAVHWPAPVGSYVLETVIVTGDEAATFPLASLATAVNVWGPLTALAVVQGIE